MTWDDYSGALERLNRAQVRREMDGSLEAEMNYWRARCTVAEIERDRARAGRVSRGVERRSRDRDE